MFTQICFANFFFKIYLVLCNQYNCYMNNEPVYSHTIHQERSIHVDYHQDHIERVNRLAVDSLVRTLNHLAIFLNFKKKDLLFHCLIFQGPYNNRASVFLRFTPIFPQYLWPLYLLLQYLWHFKILIKFHICLLLSIVVVSLLL